jgi:hypothetical protein
MTDGGPAAGAAVQGMGSEGGMLADDLVKLVAYFIVSLEPEHERLMPGGADTIVVTDNMSDETFTSYAIARYFQSAAYRELSPNEKAAAEDERKYLRVHFAIVRRWPREPRKYDERQIAVLNDISRELAGCRTFSWE